RSGPRSRSVPLSRPPLLLLLRRSRAAKYAEPAMSGILVAGIGNIFHGDDGFGVEVAQRMGRRELPPQVKVTDFGIRGLDLIYALAGNYRAVILVDAAQTGEAPGTLSI